MWVYVVFYTGHGHQLFPIFVYQEETFIRFPLQTKYCISFETLVTSLNRHNCNLTDILLILLLSFS